MRRALHILSVALITAGVVILADVATTLAWREPVSSLYGSIQQHEAASQLADLEQRFPSAADLRRAERRNGSRQRVGVLADLFAKRVQTGEAIGRIVIPSIGLNVVAVQGTDTASLQKGPGHYPDTPFPGQGGTTAFAGHRTTYLAPFRHLDSLGAGDLIQVEMPYATFSYRMQGTRVVSPSDVGIVHRVGYDRLVLTACHPLYSAAERIVAFARLKRVRADSLRRG
ncbi:MAG: class E sortase [Solirubrobacterales bacterium]